MFGSRQVLLFFFFVIMIFNVGCGFHQKYWVDGQPGETEKNSDKDDLSDFKSSGNVKTDTEQLLELGRVIQSYLGRPYSGKSRSGGGLDCSQFVQKVFTEFNGMSLPRTVKTQINYGTAVNKSDLHYGDLVFFRTDGRGASHVGIYIGYNEFIHSSTSSGVIISSMSDKYWKKRYVAARRILR